MAKYSELKSHPVDSSTDRSSFFYLTGSQKWWQAAFPLHKSLKKQSGVLIHTWSRYNIFNLCLFPHSSCMQDQRMLL